MKVFIFFSRVIISSLLLAMTALQAGLLLKPTDFKDGQYEPSILTGDYDGSIDAPESFLTFKAGSRVATPEQISQAILHWQQQSKQIKVIEYAKSHEGRPLHYVVISSEQNLNQLESIKNKVQLLASGKLEQNKAKELINQLPAIAWLGYSIHGNETSGADAALLAVYHLIASQSDEVNALKDKAVILIDPLMNPDGRARFAKELEQHRGVAANVDDQSLLHSGAWPYGRTNHYYFDLNRDFIYGTQPETVGRIKAINSWFPQLMVDGHEMGAQDTYLFAPAIEPVNPHLPESRKKWGWVFATDQAKAFDKKHWPYYTGEWFENLYPGYSNYAEYRGAVHILYEQARMAEDGVRRPEGRVQTYLESVHHQFVSTIENLKTLVKHSQAMYQDFYQERKSSLQNNGEYANRKFVIFAGQNGAREQTLLDLLQLQNIEVEQIIRDTKVTATNHFGEKIQVDIPKGSYVVANKQAEARLIAAMFEFDANIKPDVLKEERSRTLRDGSSLMYDTTAWNITMMFGLKAVETDAVLPTKVFAFDQPAFDKVTVNQELIAFAVDGINDRSVGFAARLLEQQVQVRAIDKKTRLGEHELSRGSIIITKTDNPNFEHTSALIFKEAETLKLKLLSIQTGMGDGDLPDWGGQHFRLLVKPQIALLSRGGFASYDVGALWYSLDRHLGIRHSQIDSSTVGYADLRRYNIVIMPEQYYQTLDEHELEAVKAWVENGGTLIAIGDSAVQLSEQKVSSVKMISETFEQAEKFDTSLHREWLAQNVAIDLDKVNARTVSDSVSFPWGREVERLTKEKLEQRDTWQARFMPSGSFLAARTDQKHWLSFGVDSELPVLFSNNPVLMSDDASDAVLRLGVYRQTKTPSNDKPNRKIIGWSTLPENHELLMRASGLVWPEAAQRLANAAYVTRESVGKGQVILFAHTPNFRGATLATNRLFLNAVVYGPGLGTKLNIAL